MIEQGDFALIEWNGNEYTKIQHYHIVEVNKKSITVRVPGSYIKLIIPKSKIKRIEKKQLQILET